MSLSTTQNEKRGRILIAQTRSPFRHNVKHLFERPELDIAIGESPESTISCIQDESVDLVIFDEDDTDERMLSLCKGLLCNQNDKLPPFLLLSNKKDNPSLVFRPGQGSVVESDLPSELLIQTIQSEVRAHRRKQEILRHEEEQKILFKKNLERYVSNKIAEAVMQNPGEWGRPKRTLATIFVADIKNSSAITEQLAAEEVAELLSTVHDFMMNIIFQYNGTIDKIMGDGLMAIFGVPYELDYQGVAAVSAAIDIANLVPMLPLSNILPPELQPLDIRFGISSGTVIAGNIGGDQIMDYTVIGKSVNKAFRLEKMTRKYDETILICEKTKELCEGKHVYRDYNDVVIQGIPKPCNVYGVEFDSFMV